MSRLHNLNHLFLVKFFGRYSKRLRTDIAKTLKETQGLDSSNELTELLFKRLFVVIKSFSFICLDTHQLMVLMHSFCS